MKFVDYPDWGFHIVQLLFGLPCFIVMDYYFEGNWDYTWDIVYIFVLLWLLFTFGVNYLVYRLKKRNTVKR